jgi:hypothetical protein
MGFQQRLKDYFQNNYKPGERKLLQKIDFFILTFCCLSYFVNYVRSFDLNTLATGCYTRREHLVELLELTIVSSIDPTLAMPTFRACAMISTSKATSSMRSTHASPLGMPTYLPRSVNSIATDTTAAMSLDKFPQTLPSNTSSLATGSQP